jgi:RNA 2',3'-cyclic 3'-phosphodiesterase
MPILFVAIDLPDLVREHLSLVQGGIPGARWEAKEKLHLTLRYVGDVDGGMARRITQTLGSIEAAPFELQLAGVGHFPPRGRPRSVWVGVEDPRPLHALHEKIERVLTRLGLEPERRNFAPHVTIARLRNAPERKVGEFIAHHALLRPAAFEVTDFALLSSVRGPAGSTYRVEARFRLSAETS